MSSVASGSWQLVCVVFLWDPNPQSLPKSAPAVSGVQPQVFGGALGSRPALPQTQSGRGHASCSLWPLLPHPGTGIVPPCHRVVAGWKHLLLALTKCQSLLHMCRDLAQTSPPPGSLPDPSVLCPNRAWPKACRCSADTCEWVGVPSQLLQAAWGCA